MLNEAQKNNFTKAFTAKTKRIKCQSEQRSFESYIRRERINYQYLDNFNRIHTHHLCSAPALPKVEAKAKTLKAKKAVLKGVHGHKTKKEDDPHAFYDVNTAKVNTLIRPDGGKKAYVQLAPDCDALDVANEIGII
ncbi:hypothetical protein Celaphus_00010206 [Cervus elaphus hippelaphus]|uniref:Uncharacterized protein n=1 Tax=Cervus elaphus hippelaphus TaxID=46360 RepID=A0A212C9A8_CEREH|nr:hypothetical protein Celaphus_00010206 [Cervus elaphus hippelaphus]